MNESKILPFEKEKILQKKYVLDLKITGENVLAERKITTEQFGKILEYIALTWENDEKRAEKGLRI